MTFWTHFTRRILTKCTCRYYKRLSTVV